MAVSRSISRWFAPSTNAVGDIYLWAIQHIESMRRWTVVRDGIAPVDNDAAIFTDTNTVKGAKGGVYYASLWGFASSASATTNTAAINSAVSAAAAAGGGIVQLPAGDFAINAINITDNHITVRGVGMWGTRLRYQSTTGDCFLFNSSVQHSGLRDLTVSGADVKVTANYAVAYSGGAFQCFAENLRIEYMYNGIYNYNTSSNHFENIMLRHLTGSVGCYVGGGSSAETYGIRFSEVDGDNPYPNAHGTVKTWATSTAYALNDIVRIGTGGIWQCVTAGTSASTGTGPGGAGAQPGTNGENAFSTVVADGTAEWRWVCHQTLIWFEHADYASSVSLLKSDFINGWKGVLQTGANTCKWFEAVEIDIDHPYDHCMHLYGAGGEGMRCWGSWIGSSLQGAGVVIDTNYQGELVIDGCRITSNWQHGILLQSGPDDCVITNCHIALNSQASSATYHGIAVGAGASYFIVTSNFLGRCGDGSGQQGYGIVVNTGASDYYVIHGNIVQGNVTAGLADAGTGTNKTVASNH